MQKNIPWLNSEVSRYLIATENTAPVPSNKLLETENLFSFLMRMTERLEAAAPPGTVTTTAASAVSHSKTQGIAVLQAGIPVLCPAALKTTLTVIKSYDCTTPSMQLHI